MASRISTLASAVKKNPDDSFSKFALALELLKIGEATKARRFFEDIKDNDPGYVGVYYHLGKLYVEMDENKKALKTYKQGIKVAEEQNDAHSKTELSEALFALELDLEE